MWLVAGVQCGTRPLGVRGTRHFQSLLSTLCRPIFCERKCPLCATVISINLTFFAHLNDNHLNHQYGLDEVRNIVEDGGQQLIIFHDTRFLLFFVVCMGDPERAGPSLNIIISISNRSSTSASATANNHS